jgi:hypothetical protein
MNSSPETAQNIVELTSPNVARVSIALRMASLPIAVNFKDIEDLLFAFHCSLLFKPTIRSARQQ